MDSNTRLRVATRIHFALLRHYGEDVAVSSLLKGGREASEALWVCDASGQHELASLAKQFRTVTLQEARRARASARQTRDPALPASAPPPGGAPHDLAWSRDTSGFGVAVASGFNEPRAPAAEPARWFNPARWLRDSLRR